MRSTQKPQPQPTGPEAMRRRVQELEAEVQLLRGTARALVEGCLDWAAVVDPDGRIAALNEQAAASFGQRPEEMVGTCAYDAADPELARQRRARMAELLRTRRPLEYEQQRQGRRLVVRLQPVLNDGGEVARAAIFVRDVTEEHRARAESSRRQELLANVLRHTPHRVFWKDRSGTYEGCNENFARDVGLDTTEQVVGKTDLDLLGDRAAAERSQAEDRRVMETGEPVVDREQDVRVSGGRVRTVLISKAPLRDPAGRVAGLVGIATDITERTRAEEALRESEERFRSIFERGPVGMLMVGDDKRILEANNAFCEMLGYTSAELAEMSVNEITHADDRHADAPLAEDVLRGRSPRFRLEKRYLRRDGRTVWGALSSTVVRDGEGRPLYALSVVEDVTARRQALQALEEARRTEQRFRQELAALNEVVVELSAAASFAELCRRAIELGCERLGVDRLGLWFLTGQGTEVQGSFGMDESGRIRDERGEGGPVDPDSPMGRVLLDHSRLVSLDDVPLRNHLDGVVGHGAAVLVSLWDGQRIIGCMCVDNLLTDRAITADQQEVLRLYASALGHLCSRVRADEALATARDRLDHLLTASPAVTYTCQPGGDYATTFISANVRAQLGYEPEEFTGAPGFWSQGVHPEDRAGILRELPRVLQTGRHMHEYRFRHKDGRYRWVRDELNLIRDAAGRPVEIVGFWTDVTEEKRAERALRESREAERRFREQLAALQGVTVELSVAGSFEELCRRAVELSRERLGFDRLSLWFTTGDPARLAGSFGVDEEGNVRDERGSRHVFEPQRMLGLLRNRDRWLVVDEDFPLRDDANRVVGRGWHAVAAMWDGERIIGFLCADNLISRSPLGPNQREVLSLFAGTLGHLCSRRRAGDDLRASEERYRTLVENLPGAVYRCAGREPRTMEFVSDAIESITGYPAAEFVDSRVRSYADLLHPDDARAVARRLRQAVARRQPYVLEYRLRHADGSVRWIYEKGRAVCGENGQPLWLDGVILDITDLKQAEQQLRVKDSAIDSSLNAMALADLTGALTYVNPSFLRMWGYPDDREVLGRNAREFWRPKRPAERAMRAVLRQGRWKGELTAKRKDGTTFVVNVAASRVTDARGEPLCLVSSFVDVTERKRAEEDLRESRNRLQYVIDNTSDIIFEIDLKGRYTFGNLAAERLTGRPLKQLLTMHMGEVAAPEWHELLFGRLKDRIAGRELPQPFAFEIVRPDGQRVTLEAITTGVFQGKKLVGVQGIGRDITERTRAERALRAARARLDGAREAERRRLAGELHDSVGQGLIALQLGMRGVLGAVQGRRAEEKVVADLRALCVQGDGLIEEVRRAVRGLYPPTLESLGLPSALNQLVQDFAAQSRVRLTCSAADDLARFPVEVEITLFRVAQEAVTNAIRHGKARSVRVALSYEAGRAVLTVTDTGRGFNPEKAMGKGLGLASMAERVRTAGGTINVDSRRGRTRVTAVIPTETARAGG